MKDGKFDELTEILAWYDLINDVILDHLDNEITNINQSGVWRYLLSFKVVIAVKHFDEIKIKR